MGYPGHEPEVEMLRLHSRSIVEPQQVFTPESILDLQAQLPSVFAAETLLHYIVQLAEASRRHPDIALGASPRAALCLLRCARRGPFSTGGTTARTRMCKRWRWACWDIG